MPERYHQSPRHQPLPSPILTVVVILDGWPSALTHRLLDAGSLPDISDWIRSTRSTVLDVLAPFSSLSYPAHASLLTGTPPNLHGFPAHAWLDRQSGTIINLQYSSVRRNSLRMSSNVRTIYEHHVKSTAVHGLVVRGAATFHRPLSKSPRRIVAALINKIRQDPNGLFVAWLPSVDAAGHQHGPSSSEFHKAMIDTSRALGSLFDYLVTLPLAPRVLLTSDHGMRDSGDPITSYEALALIPRDRRSRYFINPIFTRRPRGQITAITSGGSLLDVYYHPQTRTQPPLHAQAALDSGKIAMVIDRTCSPAVVHSHFGVETLVSHTHTPGYPHLAKRYADSVVDNRSPDVTLVTTNDFYFASSSPRPGYNFGRHRGTHGGPSAEESLGIAIAPHGTLASPLPLPIELLAAHSGLIPPASRI